VGAILPEPDLWTGRSMRSYRLESLFSNC